MKHGRTRAARLPAVWHVRRVPPRTCARSTASNLDFRLLLATYSISPPSLPSALPLSLFLCCHSNFLRLFPPLLMMPIVCALHAPRRARRARREGAEQIRPPREKLQLKLPGIYSTLSAPRLLPPQIEIEAGQGGC